LKFVTSALSLGQKRQLASMKEIPQGQHDSNPASKTGNISPSQ